MANDKDTRKKEFMKSMAGCSVCGANLNEKPLYRNAPFDAAVEWRCLEHLNEEYRAKLNSEVLELTEYIGSL